MMEHPAMLTGDELDEIADRHCLRDPVPIASDRQFRRMVEWLHGKCIEHIGSQALRITRGECPPCRDSLYKAAGLEE